MIKQWSQQNVLLQGEHIVVNGIPRTFRKLVRIKEAGASKVRPKERVAWHASCGCLKVTNKNRKGVGRDSAECKCTGQCNSQSHQKCYCTPVACYTCAKAMTDSRKGHKLGEAAMMLLVTKQVFESRRLHHDWLLFVEVPLQSIDGEQFFRIDCVLVLRGAQCAVCGNKQSASDKHTCMVAIEHHGTSHTNAFPKKGSKAHGQALQDKADTAKEQLLQKLGVKLMQVWFFTEGVGMECRTKEAWCEDLSRAMAACESARLE